MLESQIDINEFATFREKNYRRHARGLNYQADRGLFNRRRHGRLTAGYEVDLPQWHDQSVVALIDQGVRDKGTINMVDVGCGVGVAGADVHRVWGNSVTYTGVDAHRYTTAEINSISTDLCQELSICPPHIIQGDAQKIDQILPANSVDLVISNWMAIYLTDPYAFLEGVYQLLAPEGVALIYPFPERMNGFITDQLLQRFLTDEYGFSYQNHSAYYQTFGLAFQKTEPSLDLPISVAGFTEELTYNRRVVALYDYHSPRTGLARWKEKLSYLPALFQTLNSDWALHVESDRAGKDHHRPNR